MSYNIIFAGTPHFSVSALQALIESPHKIVAVYTQPDRPSGRGQKLTASPVKELAMQHHFPIYQPQTLKNAEQQQILKDLNADLMIVVAYGLLLPKVVLQTPRLGCLNIHASLLPRWRGAAPIQRAIVEGDEETGVTIMQMDEGLDTGAILYTLKCPIKTDDTSETLHKRLASLGADALLYTLNHLQDLKPAAQDAHLATYAHKISKEEANVDWQASAKQIERKIRGFNPWPVMYTYAGEKLLRLWEASVIEKDVTTKIPGEILAVDAKGIDVSTGENCLRILKLQLPGGRVLSVSDVINAKHSELHVGERLGKESES